MSRPIPVALVDRLRSLRFPDSFFDDTAASEVVSSWGEGALGDVLVDESLQTDVRFRAAEVLFSTGYSFGDHDESATAAAVLMDALGDSDPPVANSWFSPAEGPGFVGRQLIALGKTAEGPLCSALDDDRQVLYSGSRQASAAYPYHFRVKDVAAWLIADIRGIQLEIPREREARDQVVASLRARC